MNVLDIILLAVALISAIVGLSKGFVRMIPKTLGVLLAFAGALFCAFILTKLCIDTSVFVTVAQMFSSLFTKEFLTTPVTSAGELYALLTGENAGVLKILSGLSDKIFEVMTSITSWQMTTLADYLGHIIAICIAYIVIWLIIYIILKKIFVSIRKGLTSLAEQKGFKGLDKLIGGAVALALAYVFVVGLLYNCVAFIAIKFVPEFAQALCTTVEQSSVFVYVHETNFIGQLVSPYVGVDFKNFAVILVE